MARRRAEEVQAVDVELSPGVRALVTERDVVVVMRDGTAFRLSRREAEVLASVTGPSEVVNLQARRSG